MPFDRAFLIFRLTPGFLAQRLLSASSLAPISSSTTCMHPSIQTNHLRRPFWCMIGWEAPDSIPQLLGFIFMRQLSLAGVKEYSYRLLLRGATPSLQLGKSLFVIIQ